MSATRSHTPDSRPAQILEAACRVVVRLGAQNTRIEDIAREAGVSTGAIHYYFDVKKDVLLGALRWASERVFARLDAIAAQDTDALTKLASLLELAVPRPGPAREQYVLWIEFWVQVLHEPALLADHEAISERWRDYYFRIVRDGTVGGEFHPVGAPDEVAERISALADGLGFEAVIGYRWTSVERMRGLLLRFAASQLGVSVDDLTARADRVAASLATVPSPSLEMG